MQVPIKYSGTIVGCDRGLDVLSSSVLAIECNAAASAGAANLGRDRSVCLCCGDQDIHLRCSDIWAEAFAIGKSPSQDAAECVPIICKQCHPRINGRVTDAFENIKDLTIAVDVAFGDLPIIRA